MYADHIMVHFHEEGSRYFEAGSSGMLYPRKCSGQCRFSQLERQIRSKEALKAHLVIFRTVRFDPFPFLRGADSFIGDGFSAETVFSNTGFHMGRIIKHGADHLCPADTVRSNR